MEIMRQVCFHKRRAVCRFVREGQSGISLAQEDNIALFVPQLVSSVNRIVTLLLVIVLLLITIYPVIVLDGFVCGINALAESVSEAQLQADFLYENGSLWLGKSVLHGYHGADARLLQLLRERSAMADVQQHDRDVCVSE